MFHDSTNVFSSNIPSEKNKKRVCVSIQTKCINYAQILPGY